MFYLICKIFNLFGRTFVINPKEQKRKDLTSYHLNLYKREKRFTNLTLNHGWDTQAMRNQQPPYNYLPNNEMFCIRHQKIEKIVS